MHLITLDFIYMPAKPANGRGRRMPAKPANGRAQGAPVLRLWMRSAEVRGRGWGGGENIVRRLEQTTTDNWQKNNDR